LAEQTQDTGTKTGGQQGGSSTLKPMATAAAATIAAAAAGVVAKKALSGHGGSNGSNGSANGGGSQAGNAGMFGAIASGGWDAARDALLPAAEDAAGAAGSFLAQNAPEIVRDRIVPRFIESFNEARGS
jgi:hypothetical protein